jgi:hypothetical protein
MLDEWDYKCLINFRDNLTGIFHKRTFDMLIERELLTKPEPIYHRDQTTKCQVTYKGLWEMYLYELRELAIS